MFLKLFVHSGIAKRAFCLCWLNIVLNAPSANSQQLAQVSPGGNFSPIRINQQSLPSIIPTDVTPIGLGRERELLKPGPTFYLLQKLPSRMWINGSVEVSQRGETNVFFTNSNKKEIGRAHV